jgi:ribosomal protein L10
LGQLELARTVYRAGVKPGYNAKRYPLKKALILESYQEIILPSPIIVLAKCPNLKEKDRENLRIDLKTQGIGMKSILNGIFNVATRRRAQRNHQFSKLLPQLHGHNAVFYQLNSPPMPSKSDSTAVTPFTNPSLIASLFDKTKKLKSIQISGAIIDRKYYSTEGMEYYSTLPNMDQLRAQLCQVLGSPASRVASILNQNQQSLVRSLGQRVKDMETPKV